MVSTVIPYQFAYMVACIVQLVTCTRALIALQAMVQLLSPLMVAFVFSNALIAFAAPERFLELQPFNSNPNALRPPY